jgi:uncharacterized protein YbgA (DUF1722 family)/uncharacterized protein YbbK (DUF523 family)
MIDSGDNSPKPRLGISSCLLGEKVRYNGEHKRDAFVTETLARFVEWVPVCPELEVGMGVPRESVRLVGSAARPRMMAEKSGVDWTDRMAAYAKRRVGELARFKLSGYIFKKASPSCGMERVRIYGKKNVPSRQGRGLFAAAVMKALPLLPVEEEGRLRDPTLRENFVERVFAYHRWQRLSAERKSARSLGGFHAAHKFLLLAHSEPHARRLGRLVAGAKSRPLSEVFDDYGRLFMEGLAVHATPRKNSNVLQHMMGYFSKELTPAERAELNEIIADHRRGLTPLVAPVTLVRHYVRKYEVGYLLDQYFLEPDPKELMLRNHV